MVAILLFSAATMNWFITKSRLWETAILLLCCFTLFRPAWWLDRFYPAHVEVPAREFLSKVAGGALRSAPHHGGGRPEPRRRERAQDREHPARRPAGAALAAARGRSRRYARRRKGHDHRTSHSAPTPSASASKAATRLCQCLNRLTGHRAPSRQSLHLFWRRALAACSFRGSGKALLRRRRLRH